MFQIDVLFNIYIYPADLNFDLFFKCIVEL